MAPRTTPRPISPHISVFKWRAPMLVSILHRVTGNALAFGGAGLMLWWLMAAATGADAYAIFYAVARGWFGILVGVALSWVFFQHLLSGLRHLYMDSGAGYALPTARRTAIWTMIGSTLLTGLMWVLILAGKGI